MPPRGQSQFRFNAQRAFLTYAGIGHDGRTGYNKEDLYAHLVTKCSDAKQIIVAWEHHQDGTPHAHCYLEWGGKKDIRDARSVFGFNNHVPNIQSVRSPKDCMNYVIKDNDYMSKLPVELPGKRDDVAMTEAIGGGASAEEAAVMTVRSSQDGKPMRYYTQLVAFGRAIKVDNKVQDALRQYPDEFDLSMMSQEQEDFVNDFVVQLGTRDPRERTGKSIWMYGPTRMGKTQLARSLGLHWYMQGMWNLDQYTDEADYGVIDDFDWDQFKKYGYKGLLGLQYELTVTDKYRGKKTIKHGKPVIFLTNDLPVFTPQEWAWLEGNVEFINVLNKVYE